MTKRPYHRVKVADRDWRPEEDSVIREFARHGAGWIFTDRAACDAAQAAATDALPDDTTATGAEAPVQITDRWADVLVLTDGRFAFLVKPGMALPSGATALADISALLPAAASS